MAAAKERRAALVNSTLLNGIDFVEVASADQRMLRVHFVNAVAVEGTLTAPPAITGGESTPSVAVDPITPADWGEDGEGRRLLTLTGDAPGDFSFYTLTLASPLLDPFFTSARFTFKALCPSDLDCEPPEAPCPPLEGNPPPIDYLAKDYLGFRKALSDFSALRYPEWRERSEADFGMMFLEALSSVADDLSYTQDRVAAQATLQTATERRSLVKLARLVDYEPRPATSARVLLQLDVAAGPVPAGLAFGAPDPAGGSTDFETGTGVRDAGTYPADPKWNRGILPYYWSDDQRCLQAGSTEMWVAGHGFGFFEGQALLIDTTAENAADPPIREVVHVVSVEEQEDQLFPGPPNPPTPVTQITCSASEALKFDHDLTETAGGDPRTVLAGNLVPATQGRRVTETFAIGIPPAASPGMPVTFARLGPNSTAEIEVPIHQFTLREAPLAWLAPEHPDPSLDDATNQPLPEVLLSRRPVPPATQPDAWDWAGSLLEARPFQSAFTVDRARYLPVARKADGRAFLDYADSGGDTIRFGDGVFGDMPEDAAVFDVTYRLTSGAAGNVAAGSIATVGPGSGLVTAVMNPFAAEGGADPETDTQLRQRAPYAFHARQFRAVRDEDYVAAAQELPWVQRAGCTFRWTGSWLTVFTAADPKGAEALGLNRHRQLINLLNRRRLAGYESYVPSPRYVSLDLEICVCANDDAFRGDVHAGLLEALSATSSAGFFYPDRWTFGQPLERSRLAAAVQESYGVAGVTCIQYRRRGYLSTFVDLPETVVIGTGEILRVDNDPSFPERGSIRFTIEGGK